MSHSERKAMVNCDHGGLSIAKQCKVLRISRSSFYYQPKATSEETLAIMSRMDELFMLYPFFGSRQMTNVLQREGISIGSHRVRRLMRLMGLQAIYKKPRTSDPQPEHKIYPYLLRKLPIKQANHVWCADITFVPMQKGFLYLVAVMDLKHDGSSRTGWFFSSCPWGIILLDRILPLTETPRMRLIGNQENNFMTWD